MTQLDFRFHFLPWWQHKAYRIDLAGIPIPIHYSDYFDAVEVAIGSELDKEQRAWYVKRASTQGDDMKREFPSTPEEAFEASNEQMIEARQQSRIRNVYYDANTPNSRRMKEFTGKSHGVN